MKALLEPLGEISDLGRARALLAWDERTQMPPGGAGVRAEQLATLTRIAHERTAPRARRPDRGGRREPRRRRRGLLRGEPGPGRTPRLGEGAPRPRRAARRAGPRDLDRRARLGRGARGLGLRRLPAPPRAGARAPRRYVECFELEHPYDPLLDDYEPGMRTPELAPVLGRLREGLQPLVAAIAALRPRSTTPACRASSTSRPRSRSPVRWPRRCRSSPGPGGSTDRAPVRDGDRGATSGSRPASTRPSSARALRRAARERPRALRQRLRARARADAAVPLRLARLPRVAEPAVGELGRPRAALPGPGSAARPPFPGAFAAVDAETLYRAANRVRRR